MSNRSIVACIFARGGSKGIPKKNLLEIDGRPLLAHAIEIAKSSVLIDRIVVSTDDAEIARVATSYGAEVPFMRPVELATDEAREWDAWKHAVNTLNEDTHHARVGTFVSLPPTAPLRAVDDVDGCIEALLGSAADMVITVKEAQRNPYFNMVEPDSSGYLSVSKFCPETVSRRQDAPEVYDVATVAYAARASYVSSADSLFSGNVKAHLVPSERAIDIDTPLDYTIAKFIYETTRVG